MVSYPDHVPDTFKTATNAEHVTLHDTTTDAVLALTGRMDSLTLDTLAPDGGTASGSAVVPVRGSDGVWQRALLNLTSSGSSSSSGGVTDVSSFAGYDATGTTNSNAALTAALTAVLNGAPRTLLFTGSPLFTQSVTITSALRGMTWRGTGSAAPGVGTTLNWGGSGPMIVLGSDTHPTDHLGFYYDGPQGLALRDLYIQVAPAALDTTLANGSNSYRAGTTCIQDWYGGDVCLTNVFIQKFDTGFSGLQSDLNRWDKVTIQFCRVGIDLDTQSDQFTATAVSVAGCDRAMDLHGIHGARFIGCNFIGNGTGTINPIRIRSTSATAGRPTAGVWFDGCWFEHVALGFNGAVEAFIEIGVGDNSASLSTDVHLRNPLVQTPAAGTTRRTQHLVKIGSGDAVSIVNPAQYWTRLDKLVKCVGSTSPAIKISAAPTNATAFGVLNAGTGSPLFTDDRWPGGGVVDVGSTPTGGTVLFTGDFETGNLTQWPTIPVAGSGITVYSAATQPTWPAPRQGAYAARFNTTDGVPASSTGSRVQTNGPAILHEGDEVYISFSTYIPTSLPSNVGLGNNFFVFAETMGDSAHGSPEAGAWSIRQDSGNPQQRICLAHGSSNSYSESYAVNVIKGAWFDIVQRIKFSKTSSVGFVEVWLNGVQQTLTNGQTRKYLATMASTDATMYPILTNYFNYGSITPSFAIYHDAYRIGTTYASVAPGPQQAALLAGSATPSFDPTTMTGNVGHTFGLGTPPSGTSSNHAGLATVNGTAGNNTVISGYKFTSWIDTTGVANVTFRNCWFCITDAGLSPLVRFQDAPGMRFENCTFSVGTSVPTAGSFGVHAYSSNPSNRVVFKDCAIVYTDDCIKAGPNTTIDHCYLRPLVSLTGQHGDAIQVDPDIAANNLSILNSQLYGSNDACVYTQGGGTGVLIDGNRMNADTGSEGTTSYLLHIDALTGATVTNNVFDTTVGGVVSSTALTTTMVTTWSGNTTQAGVSVARP